MVDENTRRLHDCQSRLSDSKRKTHSEFLSGDQMSTTLSKSFRSKCSDQWQKPQLKKAFDSGWNAHGRTLSAIEEMQQEMWTNCIVEWNLQRNCAFETDWSTVRSNLNRSEQIFLSVFGSFPVYRIGIASIRSDKNLPIDRLEDDHSRWRFVDQLEESVFQRVQTVSTNFALIPLSTSKKNPLVFGSFIVIKVKAIAEGIQKSVIHRLKEQLKDEVVLNGDTAGGETKGSEFHVSNRSSAPSGFPSRNKNHRRHIVVHGDFVVAIRW